MEITDCVVSVPSKEVQILSLEDVPEDALLIDHELRKSGLAFHTRRVDSRVAFLQELENCPPDVILADHGIPAFDGFTALAIAQEKCPNTPFIFVTGSLGEEKLIEVFENGATDCVLKRRLSRLPLVLQRALNEADERHWRKRLEAETERLQQELLKAERRLQNGKCLVPICAHCKNIRDIKGCWAQLEIHFERHYGFQFTHGICPKCMEAFFRQPQSR
ncbi:MAG: response regulator [Verrucomicrobiota bacterium]